MALRVFIFKSFWLNKICRQICFCAATLFLSICPASAEDLWVAKQFSTSDGLPNQIVRDIVQTDDGSIWFATWGGGIARLNGTECTTLTIEDGLVNNMTRVLFPDERGGMWVGTSKGISYFIGDVWTTYTLANTPSLDDDSVFCITEIDNGEIWFGTGEGYIQVFTPSVPQDSTPQNSQYSIKGSWSTRLTPEITRGRSVRDILQTEDHAIWAAIDDDGFLQFDGTDWEYYGKGDSLLQYIVSFSKSEDGSIWAAGGENVCRIENGQRVPFFKSDSRITSIAERSDKSLVLGTQAGLYIFQDRAWSHVELHSDIRDLYIECVFCPPDGSFWVGTRDGAFRVSKSAWSRVDSAQTGQQIKAIYANSGTDLISFDQEGHLLRFEGKTWIPVSLPVTFEENPLDALLTPDDMLWGLYDDHLTLHSLTDQSLVFDMPLREEWRFREFFYSRSGRLWIIGEYSAREILKSGIWGQVVDFTEQGKTLTCMEEDPDGSLWFAFKEFVEHWTGDNVESYQHVETLRKRNIRDIYCTRDGKFWIATNGSGLVSFDGNEWQNYTASKDGLLSDRIVTLFQDSAGTLWIGYEAERISSYQNEHWIHYKGNIDWPKDTLYTDDVDDIVQLAEGEICFGLDSGVLLFYRPNKEEPNTQIEAYPSSIAPDGIGVLKFTGMDMWNETPQSDLVYSYRFMPMVGANVRETSWSPFSKQTTIITPDLMPGHYRFEVRAMDRDRNVDSSPASVTFHVLASFWQNPKYYIPIVFLLIILVFAIRIAFDNHYNLLESQGKYKTLVETINDVIYRISLPSGEYEYISPVAVSVLGYESREFYKNPQFIKTILHPDFVEDFEKAWSDFVAGKGSFDREYKIISIDGHEKWIAQSSKEIIDAEGRTVAVEGVYRNITKRKRAEEALRDSEARYRLLIENQIDLVTKTDLDGNFLYVTPSYCEAFGKTEEELLGKCFLDMLDGEEKATSWEVFQKLKKPPFATQHIERVQTKDGMRVYSWRAKAVLNEKGEPEAIVGVGRDITKEKLAEEQLRQAHKMEAVGQLAAGIAHNINNQLMGIYGNLSLAEEQAPEDIIAYINDADKSARRTAALVQQLLAYSRKALIRRNIVDMNEIVSRACQQARAAIESEIEIEIQAGMPLITVEVDRSQIETVIFNLCINSRDAIKSIVEGRKAAERKDDDFKIVLRTDTVFLDREYCSAYPDMQPGRYAIFSVSDNGCGIEAAAQERIFEPFFTTKGFAEGMGMGLASAYGIIHQHGGLIEVSSEVGVGTTFRIYLPLSDKKTSLPAGEAIESYFDLSNVQN